MTSPPPPIVAVVGLQAGDEGKGTIVDALVRNHGGDETCTRSRPLVIRFSGGPQSAHHVVTPAGHVHAFSSLGSGTLAGARTLIGRHVLVAPERLEREEQALAAKFPELCIPSVAIDERCQLVTPWHAMLSKLRSLLGLLTRHDIAADSAGNVGHGSTFHGQNKQALPLKHTSTTGVGVGSAVLELTARGAASVLRAADLAACAGIEPDKLDRRSQPDSEAELQLPSKSKSNEAGTASSRLVCRAQARVVAHVEWAIREAGLLVTKATILLRDAVGTASFDQMSNTVATLHTLYERTMAAWPAEALVERYAEFARARGVASCAASPERIRETVHAASLVVLEGAQAILLDPLHGFPPHVTSTKTDLTHAIEFLRESWLPPLGPRRLRVVGVARAHGYRHGAGPLVSETNTTARAAAGGYSTVAVVPSVREERHNQTTEWQGAPRFGALDLVSLAYGAAAVRSSGRTSGSLQKEPSQSCDDSSAEQSKPPSSSPPISIDLELAITHLDLDTGLRSQPQDTRADPPSSGSSSCHRVSRIVQTGGNLDFEPVGDIAVGSDVAVPAVVSEYYYMGTNATLARQHFVCNEQNDARHDGHEEQGKVIVVTALRPAAERAKSDGGIAETARLLQECRPVVSPLNINRLPKSTGMQPVGSWSRMSAASGQTSDSHRVLTTVEETKSRGSDSNGEDFNLSQPPLDWAGVATVEYMEHAAKAPCTLISLGPRPADKWWRTQSW